MSCVGRSLKMGFAALLAVMASGCVILDNNWVGHIRFSPDGSTLTYVQVVSLDQFTIHPTNYAQTAYVRWCDVEQPEVVRSTKVDFVGLEFSGLSLGGVIHTQVSPDSRHLAIASLHHCSIVNLQTGRRWRLTPRTEFVASLAWLDGNTLGYAAHTNVRGKYREISDRTFWRQDIHKDVSSRVAVYREVGIDAGTMSLVFRKLEHWSPGGRYVVFMSPYGRGRYQLLDLHSGTVRAFGQSDASAEGVAWKRDGSAAMCVSRIIVGGQREALLLDSATGHTLDLSASFSDVFRGYPPRIEPLWTPDDQYVLANDLQLGGCLIRPEPWLFIPVVQRIADRTTPSAEGAPYLIDRPYSRKRGLPTLWPLPVEGWAGWYFGAHRKNYAVSYSGAAAVPIPIDSGQIAWSPNGKKAATVNKDKVVRIYDIDFLAPRQ